MRAGQPPAAAKDGRGGASFARRVLLVLAVAGLLIAGILRLMWIPLSMLPMGLLIAALTTMIVAIGWFILWIVITIKAFQGDFFRLPVVAGVADMLSVRVPGAK